MKRVVLDLLSSLLLGLVLLFPLIPAFLEWIHSDYDRYVWAISGPPPFDQFGSGPFQLWVLVGSLAAAATCAIAGVPIRLRLLGRRRGFPLLELLLGVPLGLIGLLGVSLLVP